MAVIDLAKQLANFAVVGFVTFLVGFIIAKFAGRLTRRVLSEAEINRIAATAGMNLDKRIGQLVEYVIYLITLLVILQQFGLTKLVFGILIFLALALIGFSLALAIKDFIPNFITGLFIRRKLKKQLGKTITIGMVSGKLVRVGLVASTITNHEEHNVPHLYTSKALHSTSN